MGPRPLGDQVARRTTLWHRGDGQPELASALVMHGGGVVVAREEAEALHRLDRLVVDRRLRAIKSVLATRHSQAERQTHFHLAASLALQYT